MRGSALSKKQGSRNGGGGTGARKSAGAGGPMDVGLLQQIVELMAANDLNTVDVRDGAKRIVLKRGQAVVMAPMAATQYSPQPAANSAAPAAQTVSNLATNAPSSGESEAGLVAIKSPMVGTFYSAATPEAKAFVSVGSRVDEETDVCIIEAMKVFNNIKAETRGTIAKVLVTNGQTVEFGQPLFLVKP